MRSDRDVYHPNVRNRSRFNRAGWFLAALLQFLLPAFASVADARAELESGSRGTRTHVEAYGSTGCPRIHPENCVVCRVLASSAATTAPIGLSVTIARTIDASPASIDAPWFAARPSGDPPQRAPPVLS